MITSTAVRSSAPMSHPSFHHGVGRCARSASSTPGIALPFEPIPRSGRHRAPIPGRRMPAWQPRDRCQAVLPSTRLVREPTVRVWRSPHETQTSARYFAYTDARALPSGFVSIQVKGLAEVCASSTGGRRWRRCISMVITARWPGLHRHPLLQIRRLRCRAAPRVKRSWSEAPSGLS